MKNDHYADWVKNPLYVGSIYIKPIEEKKTCNEKCFQYLWFYCCCCCPLKRTKFRKLE